MAMILGVCALLGCVLLWVMAKQRADQAEQKLLHLTAKTEHLEQHLSQTLTLIQEITKKFSKSNNIRSNKRHDYNNWKNSRCNCWS